MATDEGKAPGTHKPLAEHAFSGPAQKKPLHTARIFPRRAFLCAACKLCAYPPNFAHTMAVLFRNRSKLFQSCTFFALLVLKSGFGMRIMVG
nr:hypothetical protein [Anaerofilum sp. An201]